MNVDIKVKKEAAVARSKILCLSIALKESEQINSVQELCYYRIEEVFFFCLNTAILWSSLANNKKVISKGRGLKRYQAAVDKLHTYSIYLFAHCFF